MTWTWTTSCQRICIIAPREQRCGCGPASNDFPGTGGENRGVAGRGSGGAFTCEAYEINYDGIAGDTGFGGFACGARRKEVGLFSPGGRRVLVLDQLRGKNNIIVSEPFTYKHKVKTGDTISLALGESQTNFQIVDVYYDYASERGYILMDRDVLLKYLPDETPTNLAVFVAPGAKPVDVRNE